VTAPWTRRHHRGQLDPQQPFVVEWQGLLVAEEAGTHRLRLRADDGVALWVDETQIIDELSYLGRQDVGAATHLGVGLHTIRVRYVQRGGEVLLRLSWARPSYREHFRPIALTASTEPPPVFRRIDKALGYPLRVAVLWSVWVLAGLALAGGRLLAFVSGEPVGSALGWRAVAVLTAVALPLLALNIDVGAYPWRGWAPDEIPPRDAIGAVTSHFSGGWYHLYPPLHFYVLALVNAPITVLAWLGRLGLDNPDVHAAMHTVDRGVSLAFAFLTLLGVAMLAHRTIGPRGERLAPFILAGIPLFAYYGKTTNVDMAYTFWVTVAALALLGAGSLRTHRYHVLLGAAVAAAVASKDQAYGFFPVAALGLLWLAWRDTAPAPVPQRLARTLTDTRIWAGLVTCVALYSVLLGVWWNPEGVRAHFALITGSASVPFRMFPATIEGFVTLALASLAVLGQAVGPLVLVAAALGLGVSISEGASSRGVLGLTVLPLGYLLTFVGVVGYVYDRFLLAVLVIVALFAARGIDWALHLIRHFRTRQVVTALTLAGLLYPTASLSVRQATDTRRQAEVWMQDHLLDDPLVLGVGTALYLPNLFPYRHRLVPSASVDELLEWDPDVIVFNEDWFERPGQPPGRMVARDMTEAGYSQVFTVERAASSSGWGPPLATGLYIDPTYSNVGKVSPPLSIWMRARVAAATPELVPLAASLPPDLAGSVVFQSDRQGRDKLYRLDLATREVTPLTSGTDHRDEDPAWSPDGTRLAFATTRFDASTYDIAVMDASGESVRRVTTHAAFERQPSWAADGRSLLFSSEQDGTQAVFRVWLDTGNVERISPPPDRGLMADAAPDGRRLAHTTGTREGLQVALQELGSRASDGC
jgi:hypothetical protein